MARDLEHDLKQQHERKAKALSASSRRIARGSRKAGSPLVDPARVDEAATPGAGALPQDGDFSVEPGTG